MDIKNHKHRLQVNYAMGGDEKIRGALRCEDVLCFYEKYYDCVENICIEKDYDLNNELKKDGKTVKIPQLLKDKREQMNKWYEEKKKK